ncbi:thiamine diphosphokinase [Carnobacteriaceae bacterium zg-ZUI78]|nr:thiamine diphosphokinase [Carnobacteriaceae bacterium zg-ZUI78]
MGKKIVFCAGAPDPDLAYLKTISYDMLIGVDAGAKRLVDAGYVLDWAIGDFDSVEKPDSKESIVLPCEKDDTDLQYALMHVLSQENDDDIEEIIILGSLSGGRIDHLICNLWFVYQPRFQKWLTKFRLIEKGNTIRFYEPGEYTLTHDKTKKYLSFIGMTPLKALSLINAKYPLNKANYEYPVSLISNEFLTDTMTFSFEKGLMCVMQTADK